MTFFSSIPRVFCHFNKALSNLRDFSSILHIFCHVLKIFPVRGVVFFLFFLVFSLCVFRLSAQENQKNKNRDQRYQHIKMFSNVLHIVENFYVREVSTERLIQGAINGMVKELDLHSHFLSAEQLEDFEKEAKGQFSGLGMEITIRKQQPVIISVLENSPAREAGVKPGYIILQINGKKTLGLNRSEISKLLKGYRGKTFDVLFKEGSDTHQIKLKSRTISMQSVLHKGLTDQLLYIRINAFTKRTLREIRKAINNYPKLSGLILDIRGNPGGLFESAVKVADLFVKKGIIVSIKGRWKEQNKVLKAHLPDTLSHFPMIVLIDSYSASAAEILAGALKENGRAVLLGRKSFGKGSVQSLVQMDQGGAIKLTVAHYYTPKGNSIHERGIHPHIELKEPVPSGALKRIQFTGKEDTDFHQALSSFKMFRHFKSISNLSSGP